MIKGEFTQIAKSGRIGSGTVYKDIEDINNYKLLVLYCNYSRGYYVNPFICDVALFKAMTYMASDRRDQNANYTAMVHYESDTRVRFVTTNADAVLYGVK